MKYAWIENSTIRDLCTKDPYEIFTPQVAAFYSEQVSDEAEQGDTWIDGVITKPIPFVPSPILEVVPEPTPEPEPVPEPIPEVIVPPTVSAIEYKMLFTPEERIAAKNSIDPIIMDLQELLNDPRTTTVNLALKSVQDALDYMTSIGIIAEGRKAEILTGTII